MPSARLPLVLALAALAAGTSGCDTRPSEARRLRLDVAPFLEELSRFDAWARRLDLAESAFRSREALVEAAFAPLREHRRVTAAWLVRVGPGPTELRHPADAPALPSEGWVRVVLPDHPLEEVHAQRARLRLRGQEREVLLVRRSRPASGGATLDVTMAF